MLPLPLPPFREALGYRHPDDDDDDDNDGGEIGIIGTTMVETSKRRARKLRFGLWSPRDRAWLRELERRYEAFRRARGGVIRGDDVTAATAAAGDPPGVPWTTPGIPNTVHQIWLGPRPIPRQCALWMAALREMCQQNAWRYRLWRDADVNSMVPPLANRAAFDAASNYGEKADILRYEILLRVGGLYVDVDFEWFRLPDALHAARHAGPTRGDACAGRGSVATAAPPVATTTTAARAGTPPCGCRFYAGLSATATVELNNGLIACAPGHPLMARVVAAIPGVQRVASTAAGAVRVGGAASGAAMSTISRTGPGHFTRVVLGALDDDSVARLLLDDVLILPPSFFYPLPNHLRRSVAAPERRAAFARPESLAMHHWEKTWVMP